MTNLHRADMANKSMQRKLKKREAIDLANAPREDVYYVLNKSQAVLAERGGVDFCDARREVWIWSIGRRRSDGKVLASTSSHLYQNEKFECLWLR